MADAVGPSASRPAGEYIWLMRKGHRADLAVWKKSVRTLLSAAKAEMGMVISVSVQKAVTFDGSRATA